MRTLRWTRIATKERFGRKEMVVEIAYSNDEEKMLVDGWSQDGFYESEGNTITSSDSPAEVIDIRKAPGS